MVWYFTLDKERNRFVCGESGASKMRKIILKLIGRHERKVIKQPLSDWLLFFRELREPKLCRRILY